mmetsp:Transcript_896/g.1927  ORF Transcript_896/g.1927 Transcript_896/m.1927 type:complete len:86 (+) Transcript_896:1143-1400(+)
MFWVAGEKADTTPNVAISPKMRAIQVKILIGASGMDCFPLRKSFIFLYIVSTEILIRMARFVELKLEIRQAFEVSTNGEKISQPT